MNSSFDEPTNVCDKHQDIFDASRDAMRNAGLTQCSISHFEHLYRQWQSQRSDSGDWIREQDIDPLGPVPCFHDVYKGINHDTAVEAFAKTAFIKLNGGLGTSMGLECAKSLLMVRRHKARKMRFLDIIAGQVLTARARLGVPLPLILLNSFRTSNDTLRALRNHKVLQQDGIPIEIVQHEEPKIHASSGLPIVWQSDPQLQWCPPGHGNLYSVLWETGLLDTLHEKGFEYLFISNADNLGARPSRTLAQHFENTHAPMMIEVANRTLADRKGGHIVRDTATGRLLLREMSQVHRDDVSQATDIDRHPYFNTNNIWLRIDALRDLLAKHNGLLPLPLIVNIKTVDPTDASTPEVIQLETAIGSAVSLFDEAICVQVDRMRFLPVKTTDDLFIMRSDRFHLTDSYEMEDGNYMFPHVSLDPRYYRNIEDFNERFPYSIPSIAAANSVTIEGDWTFGQDTIMFADAHLRDQGRPSYVPNGEYIGPQGIEPDNWWF